MMQVLEVKAKQQRGEAFPREAQTAGSVEKEQPDWEFGARMRKKWKDHGM